MSVRASPDTTTTSSSPKKSATLRTPPGGAQQLLLEAVLQAVAEVAADRVRVVVEVGDQLVEALALQHADDVGHHGAVEHRDHRLRELEGDRLEAGPETRCENHGLHARADATSRSSGPPAGADNPIQQGPAPNQGETTIPERAKRDSTVDALAAVRRLSFAVLGRDATTRPSTRELARELSRRAGVDQVHVARLAQDHSIGRGNPYRPAPTARR